MAEKPEALNPRFAMWCRSRGIDPASLVRDPNDPDAEIVRVEYPDDPHKRRLPWTFVFMRWIDKMWREWAAELGFKGAHMRSAHEVALLNGHTAEEFDAWLDARTRPPEQPARKARPLP